MTCAAAGFWSPSTSNDIRSGGTPRDVSRLTVVPVVSEESRYAGEQGLLPDVVARHGKWADHDVFVCGSPDMTRATVSRLTSLGVPPERMSFDVDGDQHPAAAQVIDLRRSRASRASRAAR